MRATVSDFDPRHLLDLAAKHCDQHLNPVERSSLEGLLARDVAARRLYVRYMLLHAGLVSSLTERIPVTNVDQNPAEQIAPAPRLPGLRVGAALFAIAASILIVAAFWRAASVVSRPTTQQPTVLPAASLVAAGAEAAVASVTRIANNARWAATPHDYSSPGQLHPLDVVGVTEGEIDVRFGSGATVTLFAPALIEIISEFKGRAIRGRLKAQVAEGAEGFTMETPQASVIDLGTEFGIDVGDEGATDVVVFNGRVDLKMEHLTGRNETDPTIRLNTGEALRISKGGARTRIVSIYADRFSSISQGRAHGTTANVLISAVTDNIGRGDESWSYYEIVHSGMREDAKAFVDREFHEWNGLDRSGMPSFLLGGDYVRTFNNDKIYSDHEPSVSLSQPCRLFVLFDDRAIVPEWLARDFRDTGFNVGIDVGPFRRVDDGVYELRRKTGEGPGAEVDDVMSVWERVIDKPQVVRLGPNNPRGLRNLNMYGIVAVPLNR